jgi:hypothetical protein
MFSLLQKSIFCILNNRLITNKMLEMWTKFSKQEQEDAEKEKKENMLKDGSMMESSQL